MVWMLLIIMRFYKKFVEQDLMINKTLAHIGYVVRFMDSAIRRFQKEGGKLIISPIYDPLQKVNVCLLKMEGNVDIELVCPADEKDCPVMSRLKRGGGLDHLCFFVDDLEAGLVDEQELGGIIVCQPTYAVAFNRKIAFVHRRSGLLVELMLDAS